MVRFATLFDVRERTVTFLSGRKYSLEALRSMGAGELLNSMFEFSEKLLALQLTKEEMDLFTAVVLVSAGMHHSLLAHSTDMFFSIPSITINEKLLIRET